MVAELARERDFRGPGCSDECKLIRCFQPGVFGRQELLFHDPESHEQYGRLLAGDAGALDVLETGTMAINRRTLTAYVEGREILLSATEWRIVALLADRLDRVVPYRDVGRAMWPELGADPMAAVMLPSMHTITTVLCRMRVRLGPSAAGLIETRKGLGLRLRGWPIGQPATAILSTTRVLNGRWSIVADRCINPACGTTERWHAARGRCTRCARYWLDHGVEHPGHDLRGPRSQP